MKKIYHLIQFIIIFTLFKIFKLIGYRASSNLGNFIGINFGSLFRSKKLIIDNLEKAKIDKKLNHNKIAKNVLGNYGRIFSEYMFLKYFKNDKLMKKSFLFQDTLIILN